jgi:hypothetical protein
VIEVNYCFGTPDLLLKLLPGNDFSRVVQQDGEHLERLALQFDADSALAQLTGSKVHFENAKPDFAQVGRNLFNHGTSTAYHNEEPGLLVRRVGSDSSFHIDTLALRSLEFICPGVVFPAAGSFRGKLAVRSSRAKGKMSFN